MPGVGDDNTRVSYAATVALLKFTCAAAWIAAYLLIIRRGFLDRCVGMPAAALVANLSIEFVYGFPLASAAPRHFGVVYRIWWLIDLVMLYQAIRFGRGGADGRTARARARLLCGATIAGIAIVWGLAIALADRDGRYAAFTASVMMSILFLRKIDRDGAAGQSLYIGAARLTGNTAIVIALALMRDLPPLIGALAAASMACDAAYLVRLHRWLERRGLSPRMRV